MGVHMEKGSSLHCASVYAKSNRKAVCRKALEIPALPTPTPTTSSPTPAPTTASNNAPHAEYVVGDSSCPSGYVDITDPTICEAATNALGNVGSFGSWGCKSNCCGCVHRVPDKDVHMQKGSSLSCASVYAKSNRKAVCRKALEIPALPTPTPTTS